MDLSRSQDEFTNCLLEENKLMTECLQLLHTATSLPTQNINVNFSTDLLLCYIIIGFLGSLCIVFITAFIHIIIRAVYISRSLVQPSNSDVELGASEDFSTKWKPKHRLPRPFHRLSARVPSSVALSTQTIQEERPAFSSFHAAAGKSSFITYLLF